MSIYAKHMSTRLTPQSEPVSGKPMVPNSGGGYTFAVDKWARLNRFLVLGSEGGSYYATERELTLQNAECLQECLAEDAARTVRTIVEISDAGRAPKNDPAVFALAMAAGMGHSALAMEALPRVCRIGTHVFQFAEAVQKFRGWGRGLRKGIGAWYTERPADALAYQVAKYQSRSGWSHRDLLRLAHPHAPTPEHDAIFRWVVSGRDALAGRAVKPDPKKGGEPVLHGDVSEHLPALIDAMERARTADEPTLIKLIHDYDLPRECIPTEQLNSPAVWEAMLPRMPLTALVRNLAKMTSIGLLKPMSAAVGTVCAKLACAEYIKKSRLHPLAVLIAAKTYARGRGLKGSLSWTPVSQINDALDAAFYKAFGNVEPANKRTLLAVDVSGSMTAPIAGSPLSCREASAALALVTAKTEPAYQIVGFTASGAGYGGRWGGGDPTLTPIDASGSSSIRDVVKTMESLPMGGTDCALPMVVALAKRWEVDTFVVLTDNETWAGPIHPFQALVQYRQQMGIPAKLIVNAMTATPFTIADSSDAGMLDIVGLDSATPAVMTDFSAGRI